MGPRRERSEEEQPDEAGWPKDEPEHDPEFNGRVGEVERILAAVERRQFDRRKAERNRQVGILVSVGGFMLALGSCFTAVASKAGFKVFGLSDQNAAIELRLNELQKSLVDNYKLDSVSIVERQELRSYVRLITAVECVKAGQEVLIVMKLQGMSCDAVVPAGVRQLNPNTP
jgi:hypothetical protein